MLTWLKNIGLVLLLHSISISALNMSSPHHEQIQTLSSLAKEWRQMEYDGMDTRHPHEIDLASINPYLKGDHGVSIHRLATILEMKKLLRTLQYYHIPDSIKVDMLQYRSHLTDFNLNLNHEFMEPNILAGGLMDDWDFDIHI